MGRLVGVRRLLWGVGLLAAGVYTLVVLVPAERGAEQTLARDGVRTVAVVEHVVVRNLRVGSDLVLVSFEVDESLRRASFDAPKGHDFTKGLTIEILYDPADSAHVEPVVGATRESGWFTAFGVGMVVAGLVNLVLALRRPRLQADEWPVVTEGVPDHRLPS